MSLFTSCVCRRNKHVPKVSKPLHLLLQGFPAEPPRHVFKAKKVKKGRPCHLCHQPVIKVGSCCKVCKYLVHKSCEPTRNNNETAATGKPPGQATSKTSATVIRSYRPLPAMSGGSASSAGPPKMDLVYVTERIISLVFPTGLQEASYRSLLREVAHMLSSKHGDNFKVFDLSVDSELPRYLPRVVSYSWPDTLAPPLERICSVCKALDSWLNHHPQYVAVLHARNGYEKVGVVIAAFMHYSSICASTDQALDRYAMKRFFDDKIVELPHPSQKRYVQYFAGLLSGLIRINSRPIFLHTLTLYGVPHFEYKGGCYLFIKIYQGMTPIYTSGVYDLSDASLRQVTIALDCVQLRGDILLKAYHRRQNPPSREVILRLQFHTCAISDKVLPFARQELDDACNDLRFPLDGGVELLFSHTPEDRPGMVSNVSCDKMPCSITAWDSYENFAVNSYDHTDSHLSETSRVTHTLGPLDGSLYATVSKRRHQNTSTIASTCHAHASHVNGTSQYAPSVDSGIASTASVSQAPASPPTSDSSRASAESSRTAPVAAATPRPSTASVAPTGVSSRLDARQLDELLAGMLLDIQSMPDVRPCQTPAPDIDSIRCPDFTSYTYRQKVSHSSSHTGCPPPKQYSGIPTIPINGVSFGSTTQDSLLDTSFSTNPEEVPYHARKDSKPFSYGAVTSSPILNRRRSPSEGAEDPQPPLSPSIHRRNSRETLCTQRAGLESPRLVRKMTGSVGESPGEGKYRSPSPSPERAHSFKRERSQTLTTRIMSGTSPHSTLSKSSITRSASKLDDSFDGIYSHESMSRSMSYGGSNMSNMTWLQMQQRKLQERRDARFRAERGPFEARMMSELRSRMSQSATGRHEYEDGYISDTTLLSETSREMSPPKSIGPLSISTSSHDQKPPLHSTPAKGNSAPSSPILNNRSASKERIATTTRQGHFSTNPRSVSRKHSDITHDRERPFVAIKRAHGNRTTDATDSSYALSQLQTSPLGQINYSSYTSTPMSSANGGLLATVLNSSNQGEDAAWQSDTELSTCSGNRPITPAFPPVTPTTPYLNQGLPPKSPTTLRREMGSLRSPSPASAHIRHEVNGHTSPAPSLYYGQSRRSSLTSLAEPVEVISSHPKFVKDISKFWYKPSISREEAISSLKDKPPGTFVVRDSSSFPGAFGLALKVSTPPPNVANKSGDPSNELVRHFLIEPTSRGVRLKGSASEPVFGSLSALVYQHSITALALPCRLLLPDRDPTAKEDSTDGSQTTAGSNNTQQLLQQGAACNVLYMYSADMESLTGPQAVKRAVQLMLAARTTPAIVHFKVSSQGITLTDSSRQLFFRRHYPVNTISHCGLDPDDRRWAQKNEEGIPIGSLRIFGFVAKKGSSKIENQCHIFAELEPEQPATAICNFVTKVMMTSISRSNLV